MGTTSFAALRRFAGIAFTLFFMSAYLCVGAAGQTPLVVPSVTTALTHPDGWGTIFATAIDMRGDWVVNDFSNQALYEFPANGGPVITLVPAGGLAAQNPGVAIDSNNTMYLSGNWNNCLLQIPYDWATGTWPGLATFTSTNASNSCSAPYNFMQSGALGPWGNGSGGSNNAYWGVQPWGIAVDKNNNLWIDNQTWSNLAYQVDVSNPTSADPSGTTYSNPVETIYSLGARAPSVAVDPWLNSYYAEEWQRDAATDKAGGRINGIFELTEAQYATAAAYTNYTFTGVPIAPPAAGTIIQASEPYLINVAPAAMANTAGIASDPAGNLYASDLKAGIYLIPNPSGTPDTANAIQLSPLGSQGSVSVDPARHIVYVPINNSATKPAPPTGFKDVEQMNFGYAEFGSSPVGTAVATPVSVNFAFYGDANASPDTSVTPSRIIVVEDGVSTPDFVITGATCALGTSYGLNSDSGTSCTENVTMTPHTVGSISAKLLMQTAHAGAKGSAGSDASATQYSALGGIITVTANNTFVSGELISFSATKDDGLHGLNGQSFNVMAAGLTKAQFEIQVPGFPDTTDGKGNPTTPSTSATVTGYDYDTVASIPLHGTGMGANIFAAPSLESAVGSGLLTPSQIAVDGQGNAYIADAGLAGVVMVPAGSGVSTKPIGVGTGLQVPTGVAVDGTGDIFIADSGSIYEIPYMAPGLNDAAAQITVATGLGGNLRLAVNSLGDVYVADPDNHQVVRLGNLAQTGPGILGPTQISMTNGFTAPSYVAVDSGNNLYIIDGANLFEVPGGAGAPLVLMNNLSGATGLAVDPSGAIYITSVTGTQRIPFVSGALLPADATAIASDVTGVSSVALDHQGNVYLVPTAGGSATLVSTAGTLNFGTFVTLTQTATLDATITNAGNMPLTVTGYTSSNSVDYAAADGTCVGGGAVAPGDTCEVAITLNPGPGEQGTLTGQIGLTSNSYTSPLINTTGVGAVLADSLSKMVAGSGPEVINTPVSISVAPKSGTGGMPTGTVTVTFPSWTVSNLAISPTTASVTATLSDGVATFNLSPVLAGAGTFAVSYSGDRVYGKANSSINITVAKSAITALTLPVIPDPTDNGLPYVLPQNGVGTSPYDGTALPWQYPFLVKVLTPVGVPTGTLTFMDDSTVCPAGTRANGLGVATCALTNYKGIACPLVPSNSSISIQNAGTPTGAQAIFKPECLYEVPQNINYTPVIFTHAITPVYAGDANFLPMTGAKATLFQALRGPMVQITTPDPASATSAPSLSVPSGSSASVNLTLTSIAGYGIIGLTGYLNNSGLPVTLACSNLPPHSACTFSYPNPDPTVPTAVDIPCPTTGNASTDAANVAAGVTNCTPGVVTVTINTNVSAGTTVSKAAQSASISLAAVFGFGMVGLFFRRKSFEKGRRLLMVFLMIVGGLLGLSLTACNTTQLSPIGSTTETTPGTYPVTITAEQVGGKCEAATGSGLNCVVAGSPAGSQYNGIAVYGSGMQVSLPFVVNVTVQ